MSARATGVGAAIGVAIALAAGVPMLRAIAALGEARGERARVMATLAAPPPALDDARWTPATGARAAAVAAAARVRRAGGAGGVLVERIAPAPSPAPRIAAIALAASGSERAVIAFADAIERGDPVLRWSRWRLRAAAGGAVRIEGEVIAPWR